MSFSFGTPKTTAAPAFGVASPTAAKPAFSFGNPAGAVSPPFGGTPSGFSFGGTPAAPATTAPAPFAQNPAGGLNFGATATPASTGFGFTGTTATPTGFGFKSPTTLAPAFAQAAPTSGFSFVAAKTVAATTASSTINWGSPTTGLNFGQTQPVQPIATPGLPSFGQPTTTTPPSSAFGFTSPVAAPSTGLSFGATTNFGFTGSSTAAPSFATATSLPAFGATAAQPSFSTNTPAFGVPSATQAQPAQLPFNTPGTIASPGFGLTTPASQPPAFQPPASQPTATTGFSFNQATTTTQSPVISGFSFATKPVTTTAPTTALGFGGNQVSTTATTQSFGLTPATAVTTTPQFSTGAFNIASTAPSTIAQPIATTAPVAGFGFSFANPATIPPAGVPAAGATTTVGAALSATPASAFQSSFTGFKMPGTTTSSSPLNPSIAPTLTSIAPPSTAAPTSSLLLPPATNTALAVTTSALAPISVSLGISTSAATTTTAVTTTGLMGFQMPATTSIATSTAVSTTVAVTSSSTSQPTPITSMNFGQLEESINKWSLELEEQKKVFINQATQVNAWDKLLIANGDKIVALNDMLQNVRTEQQNLDHEMDFINSQQRELEELLVPLEKDLSNVVISDPEREHTYQLADSVDTQLKQMSEDLKEIIDHLNESNRSEDNNDPIVQIGKILNAHISSMQWVDAATAQISNKLEQLSAMHNTLRRDNERSFHLTYN